MNTSCYKLRRKGFDAMIGAHWKFISSQFAFFNESAAKFGTVCPTRKPQIDYY